MKYPKYILAVPKPPFVVILICVLEAALQSIKFAHESVFRPLLTPTLLPSAACSSLTIHVIVIHFLLILGFSVSLTSR